MKLKKSTMKESTYLTIVWVAFIAFVIALFVDIEGWSPIITGLIWVFSLGLNPDGYDPDKPAKRFHTDGFLN